MDLCHLISNAQNLPNIPKVVQELIESFGSETVDSSQIADKLNKDQAMTAKVLRMANSAKYGGHRKIGSVNDAVVLMGFNALRTMVLASGLTAAFITPQGFDIKEFWRKSFGIASLSKWIAQYMPDTDTEIAFTCGMLHDVGDLLVHILLFDEARQIDTMLSKGAGQQEEIEKIVLGFTYPEAGAELANRWKFPDDIVDGIRYQRTPCVDEDYKSFAGIIYIAQYLYHHRDENKETLTQHFPTDHADQLGIDIDNLLSNIDEIDELDSGIDALLG